ncbi:tyrosine-type recombinase/integrase [Corynebacteriaceae bacterium 7-707]
MGRPEKLPTGVEKLASGAYRARYRGPDGKSYRRTFGKGPDSKWEAGRWRDAAKEAMRKGEWVSPDEEKRQEEAQEAREALTVGAGVSEWLGLYRAGREQAKTVKNPPKPGTYQTTRNAVVNRILGDDDRPGHWEVGTLKDMPLYRVTKRDAVDWWEHIEDMYSGEDEEGEMKAGASVNRKAYMYLRRAFDEAMEREHIDANPVNIPGASAKRQGEEKRLPSTEEIAAVFEALEGERKLLGVLTLFHGLRVGEALALRRSDLRQDESGQWSVQVRRNLSRVENREGKWEMIEQSTPKTAAGNRSVQVFRQYGGIVERHLEDYAAAGRDGRLILDDDGGWLLDTSARKMITAARKRAGIDWALTPHSGRRWLTTFLAERQFQPRAIGQMLGQSDLSTITEIYMRVNPEYLTRALNEAGAELPSLG